MKKLFYLLILVLSAINISNAQEAGLKPTVDHAVYFDISPPLRDMMQSGPGQLDASWKDGVVPNQVNPNLGTGQWQSTSGIYDPGLQDHNGLLPSDSHKVLSILTINAAAS